MAKARKSTIKRTKAKTGKRRSTADRGVSGERVGSVVVGLVIAAALIAGVIFLGSMGYRSAIASKFFEVRSIEVNGTQRSSPEDVKRIVAANTERSGVWMADIAIMREKIEKLPFVRSASVTMMLPSGLRVNVVERVPAAIVRLGNGDQLVDSEGTLLALVSKPEPNLPFAMRGWDESKTPQAQPNNLARLKLYKKMVDEWREYDIDERVTEVDLSDLREPKVTINEGGRPIGVTLTKDNLAKGLRSALEAVAGKGERVRSVNAGGVSPILEYVTY